ncbi:MAG: universal stress protein, partial [Desulfobacula sp.]|nr:universal stress protein [Desulfobacula sp.]
LTILYVVENINQTVEVQISEMIGHAKWSKIKQEKQKSLIKQIRIKVENFCHDMDAEHDSCRLVVEDVKIKKGNPCEEILKVSKEIDADLIVIGSHGYNLLKDVLMGSTARKVVQQSKRPVLTIKLP